MPPPRKRSRLTRHIRTFSGFKFYLGYLDISVILNLFQNPVTKKLEGKRIHSVQNNRNGGNASLIPPYILTGGEKPGNQVVYSNVITHLLRNLEYVLKRSRNMCAMTGLKIQSLTLWEKGVRRAGEGFVECQSNVLHEIDCHPELVSGAHKSLKRRGQSSVYKMLKQVQHDINFLKRTYSHINLFSYSPHKKTAFTLAEVLITLGIIGIVAALTMPAVINNTQDIEFKSMFKKQYSTISQAFQRVYFDLGYEIDTSDWTQMPDYICALADVLKVAESGLNCEKLKSLSGNYTNGETHFSEAIKNKNVEWLADGEWFTKQKQYLALNPGYKNLTFIMPDGAMINFNCFRQIFVDVNGTKKPNVVGRDIFYFVLPPKSTTPNFFATNNAYTDVNGCSGANFTTNITKDNYEEDCKNGSGWGCSPLYILD